MISRLETVIEKLRALPLDRQNEIAEIIEGLGLDAGAHNLSDDDLAVLLDSLDQAKRGEFASQDEVDKLLDTPWR